MTVIKGKVDPYWHESHLIILVLNKHPLRKEELFEELRVQQRRRIVLGEKEIIHSKSAYKYWVKNLKNQRVITEYGNMLDLTPLGKWIANSQVGTFFNREDFVYFLCPKCSEPTNLTLLKPLPHTAETNAKGRLFMDVECPRCRYRIERMGMSEILSKDEFIEFYNKVLAELKEKKIVKVGEFLEGE